MKHNKYIQDEDYDINIKLMVPLLSMLVCTICLCATTWAWYTASVSTGVNSIVAGANVSEIVRCGRECTVTGENGLYTISNNSSSEAEFVITFNPGSATFGYFAELEIYDVTNTSFIDLFVNRVYADENKGHYYFLIDKKTSESEEEQYKLTIALDPHLCKQIKINYLWASVDSNNIKVYPGNSEIFQKLPDNPIIKSDSTIVNKNDIENINQFSIMGSGQKFDIPTYKYTIRFIDNSTYEEIREAISEETIYELAFINDYEIDGYEIVSVDYDEIDTEGMYFYIDPDKEINEFVIYYQKKMIDDTNSQEIVNGEVDNAGENNVDEPSTAETNGTDSENEVGSSNTTSDTGNNNESTSDISTSTDFSKYNEIKNMDTETSTSTNNTVESLLVTETTSSEETSSVTQSTDSSSSTDTSSETETNVSE